MNLEYKLDLKKVYAIQQHSFNHTFHKRDETSFVRCLLCINIDIHMAFYMQL